MRLASPLSIRPRHSLLLGLGWLLASLAGCRSTTPPEPESVRREPTPEPAKEPTPAPTPTPVATAEASAAVGSASASAASSAAPAASAANSASPAAAAPAVAEVPVPPGHRKVVAKPVQAVTPSPDDPLKGVFTLEDATKGLPGKGKLIAEIKTDAGKLECELYDDKAPITVANFVGLARGLRPFKNLKGEWQKSAGYDGTTFHRIIKGFMIQGGDPAGTGAGEPGYVIPDEVWDGAYHSQRGLICMANRGPNTNGMQFFIMDGSAPHLDSGYTIFGKCGPDSVIEKIADSKVQGDRAENPPKIQKVTVHRAPAKK
ncbi:MAG TPA: peptidylprolyl isomerase [Polyangiaceae bacterium]|nr:peptidylprolyl isomerase [Polyangiaceae bacterium]